MSDVNKTDPEVDEVFGDTSSPDTAAQPEQGDVSVEQPKAEAPQESAPEPDQSAKVEKQTGDVSESEPAKAKEPDVDYEKRFKDTQRHLQSLTDEKKALEEKVTQVEEVFSKLYELDPTSDEFAQALTEAKRAAGKFAPDPSIVDPVVGNELSKQIESIIGPLKQEIATLKASIQERETRQAEAEMEAKYPWLKGSLDTIREKLQPIVEQVSDPNGNGDDALLAAFQMGAEMATEGKVSLEKEIPKPGDADIPDSGQVVPEKSDGPTPEEKELDDVFNVGLETGIPVYKE